MEGIGHSHADEPGDWTAGAVGDAGSTPLGASTSADALALEADLPRLDQDGSLRDLAARVAEALGQELNRRHRIRAGLG